MDKTTEKPVMLQRTLEIDREAMAQRADGDDRIPVSLSSALPVERWFGVEILEHTASAIDMARAKRGLPLLWNHDTDVVVGRVSEITLRPDGKLAGVLRFGRSTKAAEVRADVEDGVLEDISIGYRIDEWTIEEKKGGDDVHTATRWTPMEVSIVPVPADHTVGIGRAAEVAAHPAVQDNNEAPEPGKETRMAEVEKAAAPEGAVVAKAGHDRSAEEKLIRAAGRTFGMEREAMDWLDKGLSLEQVRGEVERIGTERASKEKPAGHLGLNDRETRLFQPGRALAALHDGSWYREGSFEKDVSTEIAKRLGKDSAGLYIPMDLKVRASVTGQTAGTSSLGGATVQTTVLPLIDILRNRMILTRAGATFLTGLTGNIQFPRKITTNAFNWTGENPTAANALGSLTLDTVTLSPKTGMTSTSFSRQLLIQSSEDAQAMVLNDIASVVALGLDNAGINGTGSNNQPTGLRLTSSIGNRTLGAAGAALAWADVVGLETDVATANADIGRMGYITNAKVRGKLKTTLQSTTAGANWIWEGGNDPGTINGYNAHVSNQLPSNLTQGTSTTICSSIVFGNFADLLVGEWGGAIEIILDPYTYAGQNMIAAHAITMADVDVRHPESFSKSDAVLTT